MARWAKLRSEASRARFRELIVLGQAAGGLRAGDPEPIMLAAWAIVYGLARMYADGVIAGLGLAEAPPEVLAEIVTRALGQGIERPAEG